MQIGVIYPPIGLLLWPDPQVRRQLSVYTRAGSDPFTAAFVAAIRHGTLATRPHILMRLGPPLTTSVEVFVHWKVNSTLP
jgi:hypothetical protein